MRRAIVLTCLAGLASSVPAMATARNAIVGTWTLDEAKSKAAADGNTAGLMAQLSINPDGTFTGLHGVGGTWELGGPILFVTWNNDGSNKNVPAQADGAYLKFPAPASPKTKFCYMKKVSDQPSLKAVAPVPYVRPSRAPSAPAPSRPPASASARSTPATTPAPEPVDLGPPEPRVAEALAKWIGGSKDGWTPVVFGQLRSGMLPAQVARLFPGADKVSQYGFAEVRATAALPHVTLMKFSYQEQGKGGPLGLYNLTLTMEPGLAANRASYAALVQALEAKFGPVKERERIPRMKITWVDHVQGSLRQAQLYKIGQDLTFSFDFSDL